MRKPTAGIARSYRVSAAPLQTRYTGVLFAYPFFKKHIVTTGKGERVELIDGGYCANNPTLYAIADAVIALKRLHSDLRVVSIGVGVYPEPKRWRSWLAKVFRS